MWTEKQLKLEGSSASVVIMQFRRISACYWGDDGGHAGAQWVKELMLQAKAHKVGDPVT
jgi:hypothetical protein